MVVCIGIHIINASIDTYALITPIRMSVKGFLRKGSCHLAMKENDKAVDAYQRALDLDPNCHEAREGFRRSLPMILLFVFILIVLCLFSLFIIIIVIITIIIIISTFYYAVPYGYVACSRTRTHTHTHTKYPLLPLTVR